MKHKNVFLQCQSYIDMDISRDYDLDGTFHVGNTAKCIGKVNYVETNISKTIYTT